MVTAITSSDPTLLQQVEDFIKPIREHLDLVSYSVSTVANSLFLAGKLFPSVPAAVTRSSFVALNTVGFLYLDWQISFTLKSARDCAFSFCMKNWRSFCLALVSTINAVSDMFLMIGGLAAALASWAQHPAVTTSLYTIMRPWGVLFLFVAIALDIGGYYANRYVVGQLDAIASSWGASSRAQNILRILSTQRSGPHPVQDVLLSAGIRCAMDKYTLEKLLEKVDTSGLSKRTSLALLMQIRANVATQLESTSNNLGLRAFGYGGLFLCKAYPDSLVQAITLFVTSLMYTASRADKKVQEWSQRTAIQQA